MTKSEGDDIVSDAATGRQIGGDSNVVELFPRAKRPIPVSADYVDRVTIRANLPAGMTVGEICDRAAQAELAALLARLDEKR